MDQDENFLKFLNPELVDLTETHEKGGLKTLDMDYKFQDYSEEKTLFRMGNKIWVSNDSNISDCLYLINTPVTEDVYENNRFKLELEEVLVELNYAPLFTQSELDYSGQFTLSTVNDKVEVTVDWNALNYWFGNYFNIGVVQECLNPSHNKITVTGSLTRMALLRYIEEETENIFVTRYEKDIQTNVIHRYLDFLNPNNINSDWMMGVEYEFLTDAQYKGIFDANNNLTTDNYEDVYEEEDIVETIIETVTDINPSNVSFRITDGRNVVNNLTWTGSSAGFTNDDINNVIMLSKKGNTVGLTTLTKSFVAVAQGEVETGATTGGFVDLSQDPEYEPAIIPDDSYFEMLYNNNVIFQTKINNQIGHVHSEILEFGRNLENVVFERDESDTFNAISPVMDFENNTDLNRTDVNTILENWRALEVTKGDTIPMIVQRMTTSARSNYNLSNNYYVRPIHPNDDTSNSKYEYWVATAYYRAPFSKTEGDFHVQTDTLLSTEYTSVNSRKDIRSGFRGSNPKSGTVEISDENIYNIYNAVCLKLAEKQYPYTHIEVDVANLRKGQFNQYELHDKVYVKIPDSQEIVTMRVTKTSKEAHDVAKNSIELESYNANSLKNKALQGETYIECSNASFTYPATKVHSARLVNLDYVEGGTSPQYPANKLITFIVNENGSPNGMVYTVLTDANGYATINLALNPGNYSIDIYFGGDEEYLESTHTIDVNVGGTIPQPQQKTNTSHSNTNSNKNKTETVKKYWTKCGRSPDGKQLVSVARPSASNSDMAKYGVDYKTIYKTIFKNKCPECGHDSLVFDGGKANKCVKSAGAHGRGYKLNVPEHEITCNHCDSDFDGVTGLEKNSGHSTRLKMVKKPVKSSKSEYTKLVKGQLLHSTETKTVDNRKNTSNKSRTESGSVNIHSSVKKQALSIVGNSEGVAAAKKIAAWMGTNITYEQKTNFYQKPETTLKRKKGNCCCQAELFLQLCDAAGCTQKIKLQYIRVCCNQSNGIGHVFTKLTTRSSGKWRYVDPVKKNPWGNHVTGWGSPSSGTLSNYPTKPF